MFSIGDFARHGRVIVRMLRHYDALGLLRPAAVDPVTSYRAELQDRMHRDSTRLAQVEARLAIIEREGVMPTEDVQIKSVPAVRQAELTDVAGGFVPEQVGPVIQPLYDQLFTRLNERGITPAGPGVAWYEEISADEVVVHAGVPVALEPGPEYDFEIVDLPAIEQAATIVHHGPMDDVMATLQIQARWIEANGYRPVGHPRELYLNYGMGDPADWVTELQQPIAPRN